MGITAKVVSPNENATKAERTEYSKVLKEKGTIARFVIGSIV